MEATDTSWWAWGVATVIGPILLGLALLYGLMKTRAAKRDSVPRGPIPPEQRTVNAASWGAEEKYNTRPQPDTDPIGARQATRQQANVKDERESVIILDDRSR